MDQVPIIAKTPLTEQWMCITKWKPLVGGGVEAKQKFNVDNQIKAIIEQAIKEDRKKRRKPRS